MKKSFKSILLLLISFISTSAINAITPEKYKEKTAKNHNRGLVVSANANGGTSSSTGISQSFSFNPNLSLDYFLGIFGLGLDAGTFGTNTSFDYNNYITQLENLDFVNISNPKTMWRSTSVLIGPSLSIPFSKRTTGATLTLSVKGGLTFNQTPEISVIDNISNTKIASYLPSADFKKNALTLKPALSLKYWVNKNIALNVNAQYSMQTGLNKFTTGYKDLSKVNFSGTNDQIRREISTASSITSTTKGADKYLSFGIGISYFFRKGWDGTVKEGKVQEGGIDRKDIKKNESGQIVSLNIKVGKQTQSKTFGEKVASGITVSLTDNGCIILFPDNGFRVNTTNNTIEQLSMTEQSGFGEKVNQGLQNGAAALTQGTLSGGVLPGGSIVSAAVSGVGNTKGGGAASASYAKTGDKKKKKIWHSDGKDDNCDGLKTLPDGDYEFECVIEQKSTQDSEKTIRKLITIGFSSSSNVLKTRHETAKNSISNVR